MPLDPIKVVQAIHQGLSAICATCDHYWSAVEREAPSCGQDCGGPMSGGVFDKYRGPMTDFSLFCFVCSNKSTHGVRVGGHARVIGCCAEHIEFVQKLKPLTRDAVNIVVISKDGEKSTDEMAREKKPMVLKIRNDSGS